MQFDDLAPDTYRISVKAADDSGAVVLSGSAKATVTAGQTATVTVDLESALGNLTVDFAGAESDSVAEYTVILSGPNESKKTQEVTARTVQFEGLIPGDYTVSVSGQDSAGTIVLSGTAKATVVEGQPVTATVNLELSPGILTVNFSETGDSTASNFTIELTGSNGTTPIKTVSGGSTVQFDDLAPDTYNISVKGNDASGLVVLYGTSDAAVTAGATASAEVDLMGVVNDLSSLQQAVTAGGTIYIGSDINVASPLTVNTDVTLLPAYKNVTLTNNSSGNLFIIDNSSGNLTIGGGEYIITLDGNQVAQSIILVKADGTATLTDNGIITNAAASGVNISSYYGIFEMTGGTIMNNTSSHGGAVSMSNGTFSMTGGILKDNKSSGTGGAVSMSNGTFSMTGGSITGNTAQNYGGGVCVSGGTFNLSGGSISNNSATYGSGVSVNQGSFKMSGSAVIDSNNDVYLNNSKTITITGELTGGDTVATITLASYNEGTQVLSAESGVDLANEVGKFAVTPNPADDSEWTIDPNTGNLVQ